MKTYRSLTAEQKRILREKRLEMNRPIGPLLEFLRPLAACDSTADKVRTKLGCTFGIALVVLIAAIFFFAKPWTLTGIIVVSAIALVMLGSFFMWRWTSGIDVSNNFRQFTIPVLTVLRDDFAPDQPVHLVVDLTSPTTDAKKTGEGAPFKHGAYHRVVDTTYVDPWMSFGGMLVDGTKLSWKVEDKIRERKKTKRNARGKTKTKTKYKKKSEIDVSVAMRKKTYALGETQGEISSDDKRHVVKLEREVITASLDPIDPRALLDLVAQVYRTARPAKESA
ncbi:MAG TPA: hypothetical protein VNI54_02280 [Thermoanaerobaculia bacterium]|nr:hypothetical protein [Thermoanaerobaculia bacterium]